MGTLHQGNYRLPSCVSIRLKRRPVSHPPDQAVAMANARGWCGSPESMTSGGEVDDSHVEATAILDRHLAPMIASSSSEPSLGWTKLSSVPASTLSIFTWTCAIAFSCSGLAIASRTATTPVTPPCNCRSPRSPPPPSPEGSCRSPPVPFESWLKSLHAMCETVIGRH